MPGTVSAPRIGATVVVVLGVDDGSVLVVVVVGRTTAVDDGAGTSV